LKHIWLTISNTDIETEITQCEQEGKDLSALTEQIAAVRSLDLDEPRNQRYAEALLDLTRAEPIKPDFPYQEPSDLESIRAARPSDRPSLPTLSLTSTQLEDRVYGAWVGRCAGCLLGKPVEGWRRTRMWGYLQDLDRWPLKQYFTYHILPEIQRKYELNNEGAFADLVDSMPEDDDTNYTTTGLAILKRYGPGFAPADVAEFWMCEIPILHTCTAERAAYRNFCLQISPPESASFRNPYREWIGAQIRADFWGYAAAGNPELAAEFAWRDACVSHVKNGIYGEMLAAAMIAGAFVTDDIAAIIECGLGQIPRNCRLSESIRLVMDWRTEGLDYDGAVERLHSLWDEDSAHDWCHTISNATVVAIGLLWGEGDFGKTICRAVQPCFDTDCNGATTGSILGIIHGRRSLPSEWVDALNDTLHTGVAGYHTVRLSDMARKTVEIIEKVAGNSGLRAGNSCLQME
jgi:hypothetical protein